MSYKCDRCSKIRKGSELKRIDEVRNVDYNRSFLRFNRRERIKTPVFDTGFKGQEIVKEERLCESCYEELRDVKPKVSKNNKSVSFVGIRRRINKNNTKPSTPDFQGLKDKFKKGR